MAISKKTKKAIIWPYFLGIFLILLAFFYRSLLSELPIPDKGYVLAIQKGDSYYTITQRLANDNIIPNEMIAKLWLKIKRPSQNIYPSEILIKGPQSTISLFHYLDTVFAKKSASRITIIEGIQFNDLLKQLSVRTDLQQTSKATENSILKSIGAEEKHPEGLFAPDTYSISMNQSDISFLKMLYERQKKILADEWQQRAQGLPYKTPYEALIMASIVEKETGNAAERAQIAGVFVRRLQMGMRLQTDPTVIYGMGSAYKGNLRKADLLRQTPYNTYRIDGLPPTPIALPGRAAIHAALNPSMSSNAIYFVAKGDGSHVFSATLDAHNKAVVQYQKKRVDNYRSAPAN